MHSSVAMLVTDLAKMSTASVTPATVVVRTFSVERTSKIVAGGEVLTSIPDILEQITLLIAEKSAGLEFAYGCDDGDSPIAARMEGAIDALEELAEWIESK